MMVVIEGLMVRRATMIYRGCRAVKRGRQRGLEWMTTNEYDV